MVTFHGFFNPLLDHIIQGFNFNTKLNEEAQEMWSQLKNVTILFQTIFVAHSTEFETS